MANEARVPVTDGISGVYSSIPNTGDTIGDTFRRDFCKSLKHH